MDPKTSVSPTPPNEPQNNTNAAPTKESREVTVNFNAPPAPASAVPQPPTFNTSMDSEVSNVAIPNPSLTTQDTPPPIGPEAQPVNAPYTPQPTITSEAPVPPAPAQPFAPTPSTPPPGAQPNMGFGGMQGGAPGTTPFQPQQNAPMGQPLGPQPAKAPSKMVFIGLIAVAVILIAAIAVLFLTK